MYLNTYEIIKKKYQILEKPPKFQINNYLFLCNPTLYDQYYSFKIKCYLNILMIFLVSE